ncbi:30S ribosomal S4, chloroplastic [Gossypium arboreum]|uniref:30S ribosomal S4, chloroplastic n=2 Tax=Gossypium arboreum TaxID=29729 RepID=A0A0B0Q0I4_GOSAR|nr:30S ribosomal S4, chloroplastic [Gossypium arboreum]
MQEEPKISSRLISSGGDHGSLCHEHQNPSIPWSGGNNSCLSSLHSSSNVTKSESSASPDEIVSSSAVEDHWFTVYNVRLDLLNSPEVQNLKDVQMPVSSPKLVQGLAEMPSESEKSLGHRSHFIDVEPGTMDVATFHMKSEDSDLFKEHFGNLSAILKVEKRQSSTRRRYSSQYFVRRDYLVGCKRLFNPSSQKNESATNMSLEEVAGSIDQDLNSTKCSLTQSYALSNDEKDEEDSSTIDEESEVGEKIRACREALLSLDIAAENVFQLFTKLGTEYPMEEGSSGCRAQLYDEATELLPKIAEKINAVAKGLH